MYSDLYDTPCAKILLIPAFTAIKINNILLKKFINLILQIECETTKIVANYSNNSEKY
jgi:hypothetical protein